MAYNLKAITIRTNNTEEGLKIIQEVWQDITSGKIPLLFDSTGKFLQGIALIAKYYNYATDENGDYNLDIMAVTDEFFMVMENSVSAGNYVKYDETADSLVSCAEKAWEKVWEDQKTGIINRTYTEDYESTIPGGFTEDGKARCCLYIAVKQPTL